MAASKTPHPTTDATPSHSDAGLATRRALLARTRKSHGLREQAACTHPPAATSAAAISRSVCRGRSTPRRSRRRWRARRRWRRRGRSRSAASRGSRAAQRAGARERERAARGRQPGRGEGGARPAVVGRAARQRVAGGPRGRPARARALARRRLRRPADGARGGDAELHGARARRGGAPRVRARRRAVGGGPRLGRGPTCATRSTRRSASGPAPSPPTFQSRGGATSRRDRRRPSSRARRSASRVVEGMPFKTLNSTCLLRPCLGAAPGARPRGSARAPRRPDRRRG